MPITVTTTSVATVTPSQSDTVAILTPLVPTATSIALSTSTPLRTTATPQPTITPTSQSPVLASAPAPVATPELTPESFVKPDEGGIGLGTIIVIVVAGIAVLAGIVGVGQAYLSRRSTN